MAYKIVFLNQDGTVGVIHPSPKALEAMTIHEIATKDVPTDAVSYSIVDESSVPEDRQYRGAWTVDENHGVTHDLEKAKEIHKDQLRAIRAPLLAALDIQYQIADETRNTEKKQEVAEKKQALRDVTADPSIAAATTIEELKLAIPEILQPE